MVEYNLGASTDGKSKLLFFNWQWCNVLNFSSGYEVIHYQLVWRTAFTQHSSLNNVTRIHNMNNTLLSPAIEEPGRNQDDRTVPTRRQTSHMKMSW